jgi:hypothetical protein
MPETNSNTTNKILNGINVTSDFMTLPHAPIIVAQPQVKLARLRISYNLIAIFSTSPIWSSLFAP